MPDQDRRNRQWRRRCATTAGSWRTFQLLHESYTVKCIRHNYVDLPTVPGNEAHVAASTMKRTTSFTTFAAAFALYLQASPVQAQSARTFVSGTGNDASATCGRAAPCRTFAVAITRTNAG